MADTMDHQEGAPAEGTLADEQDAQPPGSGDATHGAAPGGEDVFPPRDDASLDLRTRLQNRGSNIVFADQSEGNNSGSTVSQKIHSGPTLSQKIHSGPIGGPVESKKRSACAMQGGILSPGICIHVQSSSSPTKVVSA